MKKQLLTLALLLVGAMANAQISKGDIQLTGGFTLFSNEISTGGETKIFNLAPQAGLFLNDKTSLGLILGYSTFESEDKTTNFNYGVYARFHKSVVDNFYLFMQPSLTLLSGEVESSGAGANTDLSGYQFNIGFGMTYFFSPKLAVELQPGIIRVGQNKATTGGTEFKEDFFNAGLGLTGMTLGVSFYLRK